MSSAPNVFLPKVVSLTESITSCTEPVNPRIVTCGHIIERSSLGASEWDGELDEPPPPPPPPEEGGVYGGNSSPPKLIPYTMIFWLPNKVAIIKIINIFVKFLHIFLFIISPP